MKATSFDRESQRGSTVLSHISRLLARYRIPVAICALVSTILLIALIIYFVASRSSQDKTQGYKWAPASDSVMDKFSKAAVACDHGLCSEIGRDIMIKGGNAVDATIASLFCLGVTNPHNSGLGGGFIMTLYNRTTKTCTVIDARETAPLGSDRDMFKNETASQVGHLAVATPGELHGYWIAYKKFGSGRVQWADLIQPSIDLATNGVPVSENLAKVLDFKENKATIPLRNMSSMSEWFNQSTGHVYKFGDIIKRTKLAETLRVEDMRQNGGIITKKDLQDYQPRLDDSALISTKFAGNYVMCGPPPPSSFAVMQSIATVIRNFAQTNEDHGTVHVSALDPEGNGVSATSTINRWFGAVVETAELGIVWNCEMDDFSSPNRSNGFGLPPSPQNYIMPNKRPMSSMSPTIVYNENSGDVKMVIGAAGGSKIIATVAKVIARVLTMNETIKQAIDAPNIYNQFVPNQTVYEEHTPKELTEDLVKLFDQHVRNFTSDDDRGIVQAIYRSDDGFLYANGDFRRASNVHPGGF
ncbi:gamma-glutamyltranspeptidase domain-containing protein [Ditylenchus destructor]|nr:gamma-glutamyltranspeptidase domain-containing protein [Ditylenchus destructor]